MSLKNQLQEINNRSDEYLPNDDFIDLMITNLGTIDPELRDKLIYSTFAKWIRENKINSRQAHYILERCLGDSHLFFCIGETNNDSVFTRSFSSLLIASLMNKDREARIFTENQFANVFHKSVIYLSSEKDTRDFVGEKGWAHAIAHGADLLDSCVKHPMYNSEFHEITLNTISSCLFLGVIYIDDEDERLVLVVQSLIDNGIEDGILETWIDNISKELNEIHIQEGYSLRYFRTKTSILNFYKTLYFGLQKEHYLRNRIEENIHFWSRN